MKLPFSYKAKTRLAQATALAATVGVLQGCSSVPENNNLVEIQPITTEQQLAQHLAEWETFKPQLEALLTAKESEKSAKKTNSTEMNKQVSTETMAEDADSNTTDTTAAAQFLPKEQAKTEVTQSEKAMPMSPDMKTEAVAVTTEMTSKDMTPETATAEPVVTQTATMKTSMVTEAVADSATAEEMDAKAPESKTMVAVDSVPTVVTAPTVVQAPMATNETDVEASAKTDVAMVKAEQTASSMEEKMPTPDVAESTPVVTKKKKSAETLPKRDGEYVVAQMKKASNIDEVDARSTSFEYTLSNNVLLDADADPNAEVPSMDEEPDTTDNYVRAQFQETERAKKIRLAKEAAARKAQQQAQAQRIAAVKAAQTKASVQTKAISVKKKAKVGEYGLQLVSHTRTGEAEKSWTKISRKFRTLLAGKEAIIEQATVKGKTYNRLKVGPYFDKKIAVDTCKQLVLSHQDCIVGNYYGEPIE